MTESVRIAAPNSLILVLDPEFGVLPETLGGAAIAASSSALAVGTLAESDGETEVTIGSVRDLPTDESLVPRWEGQVQTSGRLAVVSLYNEVLLEVDAPSEVKLQVWTNDPEEPDAVWLALA